MRFRSTFTVPAKTGIKWILFRGLNDHPSPSLAYQITAINRPNQMSCTNLWTVNRLLFGGPTTKSVHLTVNQKRFAPAKLMRFHPTFISISNYINSRQCNKMTFQISWFFSVSFVTSNIVWRVTLNVVIECCLVSTNSKSTVWILCYHDQKRSGQNDFRPTNASRTYICHRYTKVYDLMGNTYIQTS